MTSRINLGNANVTYYGSMDAAIKAVQDGEQDGALMVQFANPENPRFEAIEAGHLHFAPVLMPAMKSLTFPDGGPDLTRVFGAASEADFMPHQSGFARF